MGSDGRRDGWGVVMRDGLLAGFGEEMILAVVPVVVIMQQRNTCSVAKLDSD